MSRRKGGSLKKCPHCGKTFYFHPNVFFNGKTFCSDTCERAHYYEHGVQHREAQPGDDIIRSFPCRQCGIQVDVVDAKDHRTVYCSAQCERKYWRDRTRHDGKYSRASADGGMSGGMSLWSLIKRERRDLE